jgi:hypothetical protein
MLLLMQLQLLEIVLVILLSSEAALMSEVQLMKA